MKIFKNEKGSAMTISLGIIVILLIGSAYLFSLNNRANVVGIENDEQTLEVRNLTSNTSANKNGPIGETAEKNNSDAIKNGHYIKFNAENFAKDNGKRLYFFHATWCPSCRVADKDILANLDRIPEGLTIYKTDYDTESELKKKYGITYQHTFVQVDANENEIVKWNGGNFDEILKNIK